MTKPKAPKVTIRAEGGDERAATTALRKLMNEGWEVKQQADRAKERMAAINAKIIEAAGPGSVIVIEGQCRATTVSSETMKINDADAVKRILGVRYDELVKTAETITPTSNLKEIVSAADDDLGNALRPHIGVSTSERVNWRPEKSA